jgi:heme exporter protein D
MSDSFHFKSLWGLIPLGGAFTLAAFYSFYPSLGTFAPYVWVAFFIFAGAYILLAYLPHFVKKTYPLKAFKSKKTDFALSLLGDSGEAGAVMAPASLFSPGSRLLRSFLF